jgi:hypothetical protein
MLRKFAAVAVLSLVAAWPLAAEGATITYDVNSTFSLGNGGSITGWINVDTSDGSLDIDDFVGWDLLLTLGRFDGNVSSYRLQTTPTAGTSSQIAFVNGVTAGSEFLTVGPAGSFGISYQADDGTTADYVVDLNLGQERGRVFFSDTLAGWGGNTLENSAVIGVNPNPVPEPTTTGILAALVVAIGWRRRRSLTS